MKKITKIESNKTNSFIKPKLRVAAYCRVSTDSDEQLVSLQAQKTHYETYIKANPEWEYVGLYYDEGISGTKKEKRSELLRMILDCENKKIDLIITKSISRFARNTTDCLEMVRKLVDIGVFIYFEKENINTQSMESELMLSILSGLAESESISISENNKWAIQRRFQNGTFKISYPPFGYENIDGQMIVNPRQAEIVKYIFAEALLGKGTQKIADDLNHKGIPSKKGSRWTATTIRGILTNEKEQLTHSTNDNLAKVEEVNRLLKFVAKSKMLTAYKDELFENYVEKIIVYSREEIGFELKCGITLRERLVN